MPWKANTTMSLKREFVMLAQKPERNLSQLARRFGISRKTAYKWCGRVQAGGWPALADGSRRPHASPERTPAAMEAQIVGLRRQHPAWGARKLRRRLEHLGVAAVPAPSTITAILQRHQLINLQASAQATPWERFERSAPNELWQMDFKGHVPCPAGRCHPLTVLDDHSRYALLLAACADERGSTVQPWLSHAFRRYGLPWQMLMDNGAPWGNEGGTFTRLTVWLMRLGITVCHGRPYHPQTQGKDERFHRTLKAELIGTALPWPLAECQRRFDEYRQVYNQLRPHEALGLEVPASRFQSSPRSFPETLPVWEYGPEDQVRKIQQQGWFTFKGRDYRLSKALVGQAIALRPVPAQDGCYDLFFCRQQIGQLSLNEQNLNPRP